MEEIKDMGTVEVETKPSSNMMMIGGVIALLAILGVGFVMMNKNSTSGTSTLPENQVGTDSQVVADLPEDFSQGEEASDAMMAAQVKVVNIEAGSFYYKPNEIRVKKGEKVKIELKSVDMMHDLNVDELDIKVPVTKSGDTGIFEFTAEKTGTYEMYCSVGEHRKNGQVGTLIVE